MLKLIGIGVLSAMALYGKAQSVEDTIINQIGYKLHFYDEVAPTDITVIEARYFVWCDDTQEKNAEYCYINHNKNDVGYKRYSKESLDKLYDSVIQNEGYYKKGFDQALDTIGGKLCEDPRLKPYLGYWIPLTKYKDHFYIQQSWGYHRSFRVCNGWIDVYAMELGTPSLIKSIEETKEFDIKIKTINSSGYKEEFTFKLVDEKLKIYDTSFGYVTPASSVHNFELIQYANRSGDYIEWSDFVPLIPVRE